MTRHLFELHEEERQFIIRALAVQSLRSPGFEYYGREIAEKLRGDEMFNSFRELLADVESPKETE